jgi:hypothetical protein
MPSPLEEEARQRELAKNREKSEKLLARPEAKDARYKHTPHVARARQQDAQIFGTHRRGFEGDPEQGVNRRPAEKQKYEVTVNGQTKTAASFSQAHRMGERMSNDAYKHNYRTHQGNKGYPVIHIKPIED